MVPNADEALPRFRNSGNVIEKPRGSGKLQPREAVLRDARERISDDVNDILFCDLLQAALNAAERE
jgi:hypothetical protein